MFEQLANEALPVGGNIIIWSQNACRLRSDTKRATMMVCRPTHHIIIWKYVSGIIPGNVMYTIHACIPGNATGSSIYISFNHEVWFLEYVLSEPFTCKWSASKRRMAAISVPY